MRGNSSEQAIVVATGVQNIPAQVERRAVQQSILDQAQNVKNAPRPSVAVGKGVDGFELIMEDCHFYQRIQIRISVGECFPVRQHIAQARFAFRRGIDDLSCMAVCQRGAGRAPNIQIDARDDPAYVHGNARGKRMRLERIDGSVERISVTRSLFGCWSGVGIAKALLTEESIFRRDDVLDRGAIFCFQVRNGVNEHALVGDQVPSEPELGKRCSCGHALLEYRPRLNVGLRRKWRQIVVGVLWVQHWISGCTMYMSAKLECDGMFQRTCRR